MKTTDNPTQHTPTPWLVREHPDCNGFDIEAHPDFNNGFAVAVTAGADREANAAFIVRACNSHAQLVDALDSLLGLCLARGLNNQPDELNSINQARAALTIARKM